mgnify:FL=1
MHVSAISKLMAGNRQNRCKKTEVDNSFDGNALCKKYDSKYSYIVT